VLLAAQVLKVYNFSKVRSIVSLHSAFSGRLFWRLFGTGRNSQNTVHDIIEFPVFNKRKADFGDFFQGTRQTARAYRRQGRNAEKSTLYQISQVK